MATVGRPTSLKTTFFPDQDNNYTMSLKWSELKKYLYIHDNPLISYPTPSSSIGGYNIRTTIGSLLRQISIVTKSTQIEWGTSTDLADFQNAIRQLGLTSDPTWKFGEGKECYDILFNYTGSILFVAAHDIKYAGGHIWLCDGLKNYNLCERTYESSDNGKTWNLVSTTNGKNVYMVHYNWGLHGLWNGYYYTDDNTARPGGSEGGSEPERNYDFMREYIPIYR